MIRPDLNDIPSYVPGARVDDTLKLSSNETTQPPLTAVQKALADALATTNRYPDMGATALRDGLAAHLDVPATQVAVGTGSSALCQQLVQITTSPGEEVLFPWRSFEAYPIFAQVVGARPVAIPLTSTGHHDFDALAAAITDKTRLIFVCSPNNPSGRVTTTAQFDAFMTRVPENVLVALDEAYYEYNRDPEAVDGRDVTARYRNVVALRTFSKAYGLAGLRVGYAFGPEPIIDALNKVAIPFGVSSLAQAAALESLSHPDELAARVEETVRARELVVDKLGTAETQGNFVWLPDVDSQAIATALAAEGVLVRAFDEGVRITVTDRAEAEILINAWKEAQL
ncbi:aminotransferase [Corynebacterium yudongzhengii]|uniref:Histidinol-phosphate aminotransferase n=1 Tax=Corynebacterium yudongzhengii TaxID=2080740 RepID=A0A2U1T5N8_9CORY|nr:histidinol-phosphate transaminase [Corynebacterium yudongzhengii]AWB81038.1 aminotransferase [Corynebacterium yudongzhengii]PWC01283.1 histidinol-phosphate transaminase [Corynebacterium yudongzhengii]